MNPFLSFVVRTSITIPAAGFVWLISFFGFEQTFFASTLYSLGGGLLLFYSAKGYMKHRFIKSQGLTRREYKYIEKNLEEAKDKLKRLNKALFSVRQIGLLRNNMDILRISRKIYRITKKEPRRFYQAEKFYFYHLDSFVELAEKYSFLSNQPTENYELKQSLKETQRMIEEMKISLEKDLDKVLANDLDRLNFELDVAQKNLDTFKESQFHDESRKLK